MIPIDKEAQEIMDKLTEVWVTTCSCVFFPRFYELFYNCTCHCGSSLRYFCVRPALLCELVFYVCESSPNVSVVQLIKDIA